MEREGRRVGRWGSVEASIGAVTVLVTLAAAGCAPVRSALRPYRATPIGPPLVRPTPAPADAPSRTQPPQSALTVYVVGSQAQADVLDEEFAPFGPLSGYAIPVVVVLPDHEPFSPQPPGFVPPTSLTIVDLRP